MSFCGLIKWISPKMCILCVRVKINKRSFEPFYVWILFRTLAVILFLLLFFLLFFFFSFFFSFFLVLLFFFLSFFFLFFSFLWVGVGWGGDTVPVFKAQRVKCDIFTEHVRVSFAQIHPHPSRNQNHTHTHTHTPAVSGWWA